MMIFFSVNHGVLFLFFIDNANYDQCLVVENLSARNIPSVYDNVPEQRSEDEHAYDPLDPTKREPPSKYQSLIKPENEVNNYLLKNYSTLEYSSYIKTYLVELTGFELVQMGNVHIFLGPGELPPGVYHCT